MRRFFLFSIIGTVGFIIDSIALYFCIYVVGMDLYTGRAISFFIAATSNWFLNRHITFPDIDKRDPAKQWGRFLGCNALGGLINYTVYLLLVTTSTFFHKYWVFAIGMGSLAGLLANFILSKKLVFASV